MKILADECCPGSLIVALRSDGHDVEYVAEDAPSTSDSNILQRALSSQRVIVTEDRDFCELVFVNKLSTYGIVLVRINPAKRENKVQRVRELFAHHSAELPNAMATVTLNKIRVRPLPKQQS